MVTWSDIQLWKSIGLDPALDDLFRARGRAMSSGGNIVDIDVKSGWSGAGATAAQSRRDELEDSCELLLAHIGDLITATSAAQDGVGEVQLLVNEANSRADFYGFHIDSSGVVSDPLAAGTSPTIEDVLEYLRNPTAAFDLEALDRQEAMSDTEIAVGKALTKAREVDEAYKAALDRVLQGKVSQIEDMSDTPGLADSPPVGASTEEVAAWWEALTDGEQAKMIDDYPRELGNLDGVDGWARDKANRRNLEEDIALYGPEVVELGRQIYSGRKLTLTPEEEAKYERYADMVAIRNALDQGDVETQLLVYEPPRTGETGREMTHAAIAVGNVDTADRVTTFVPGMTTTVRGDMEGITRNMTSLKADTERMLNNGETVAAIGWIGYDAPPDLIAAASADRAVAGADDLTPFLEGIADSRNTDSTGSSGVEQIPLGHSYGSTTLSKALAQVRPGVATSYGVFGSPGTEPGWDMNTESGYALGNVTDPVTYVGNVHLSGAPGLLGSDPLTDPNITELSAGGPKWPWDSHSSYWDEGSTSYKNITRIVAGQAG
ncbi:MULTISPECIES: alpha/beta hydrolase [unclassified Actinobaculum]|uniref:alpha/beta hydrolase n=1 Tax=unclassified Actinobaculum TaxID=2609299 RepID=UPI000D5262DA|nr:MULTISPECIES: alpha/beta hydrolase [unclassified Actinobaculum]AWE41798.1 hypothetical protein DDD63_02395 [Actinobaculum sp. 313]RTE50286.1 hypothetical protein EKN07_03510 [Actinobaculum sp. 352]